MDDLVVRLDAEIKRQRETRGTYLDYGTPDPLLVAAVARIQDLETSLATVQRAAKTIMIHEADELRQLRDERVKWHQALATLDSERQANALLTDRVEALETALAEAEGRVIAEVVAWLREQSDLGADLGNECAKGTTKRAAYGGGSLALHKAATALETGEWKK